MPASVQPAEIASWRARRLDAGGAAELARVLKATGRYHVSLLAEQSAACGWPMHRSVISGVLNGRRRLSVYVVEHLALAAGVDLAFLYPSRGCFRLLTGSAVATG